ncbi:hypothetical protein ACK8OR_00595 [Jannaschia sp. KMU-145]|uniref:hypothetical protein n=1 Tax=Jannaschia halovivens TaxID=3388667 RepID=UPI00396B1259
MSGWTPDGRGWQARRDGATFALSRRLPLRWDVAAETRLPDLGRRRLAHAVRQDLWRALRDLRGFAPAVEVTRDAGGCHVRAGGRVEGAVAGGLTARVAAVLADPGLRAGWVRAARHRESAA